MAELVYASDLKSLGEIHMSSSLIRGTTVEYLCFFIQDLTFLPVSAIIHCI